MFVGYLKNKKQDEPNQERRKGSRTIGNLKGKQPTLHHRNSLAFYHHQSKEL